MTDPTHRPHRRRIVPVATAALVVATLVTVGASATSSGTSAATTGRQASGEVQRLEATQRRVYDAFDANQGGGVDRSSFYAVDNQSITKHDRRTGRPLLQNVGDPDGPVLHLDSAALVNGRIYAAHSNYSEWPMESSVEIYDARSMRHVGTHSFGIFRGSLTWLDRHDGEWWATFANYDRPRDGEPEPYGETRNTQVVRMDDDFTVLESWTLPPEMLESFEDMSNSGGSWGPDGRLWLTGHDLPEAYAMEVPEAGGELRWVATVGLPGIEGQGIAWDEGRDPGLWAISRDNRQVIEFDVPWRAIDDAASPSFDVRGPGEFDR